jgi:hypothetical protein
MLKSNCFSQTLQGHRVESLWIVGALAQFMGLPIVGKRRRRNKKKKGRRKQENCELFL